MRLFIDSPVLLFALGGPSAPREACLDIIDRAGRGEVALYTGAECIQEVVFHRTRMCGVDLAVKQAQAIRALCEVHAMDNEVLDTGLELIRRHGARGRDAFIAATAIVNGFDSVVTTDRLFIDIPGLRRLDPRDLTA